MNLYRTQVAQEILSTEENYVKTLREVVEVLAHLAASKRHVLGNSNLISTPLSLRSISCGRSRKRWRAASP
jgi:hypothetical protein